LTNPKIHLIASILQKIRGREMASLTSSVGRIADPLNEGLRVRHIANLGLITCDSTDNPEEVLSRSELAEFDQIPILKSRRIVGVLERNTRAFRSLDDSVLVSSEEHLGKFIFTLKHQPYRLVVDGTAIRGIVTWSDLLKPPVLLFAYSLLAQLELLMNAAIRKKYGDDDHWVKELDVKEQKFIEGRKKRKRLV
jgi:predicted transcriptional regulator